MEKYKFERDGVVKECHCHDGVYDRLLAEGWSPIPNKKKQEDTINFVDAVEELVEVAEEKPKKKAKKKVLSKK